MDDRTVAMFLARQDQVISRGQVMASGGADHGIARKLRRREWAQTLPGVYVAHTGPLTIGQQEWAAVLYYAPAALAGRSVLRRCGLRLATEVDDRDTAGGPGSVHVAVARDRHVAARAGISVTRMKRFGDDVQDNFSPPRVRLEHAVLDIASTARDEATAFTVLCAAVQSRRTTPARLLAALDQRPKLRHRALLRRILDDVVEGAYSVLEREYLHRVERAHALPTGSRQRRVRVGRTLAYRDVEYMRHATVVELDGRLGHELALDRWDDLERDVDALASGALTARIGWAQVLQACRVAVAVAQILRSRGWEGQPRACSTGCAVNAISGVRRA